MNQPICLICGNLLMGEIIHHSKLNLAIHPSHTPDEFLYRLASADKETLNAREEARHWQAECIKLTPKAHAVEEANHILENHGFWSGHEAIRNAREVLLKAIKAGNNT